VDAGDKVTWTVRSGEFHTVTFLSGGARPPLIVGGPGGPALNPVVAAPSGGTTYAGKASGYVNSGLLAPTPTHPTPAYTLAFTAPGDYPFVCLVHSEMAGTLQVRRAGTPYPHDQAFYDRQARVAGARLQAEGLALQAKGLADAVKSRPAGLAVTAGA